MPQRHRKSQQQQRSQEQRQAKSPKEHEGRKYGDAPGNQSPNTPHKKEQH